MLKLLIFKKKITFKTKKTSLVPIQQITETVAGGIDGRRADSSHVDSRLIAHRV